MKSYELTNYSPLNTVIIDMDTGKEIRCISSTPNILRGTTKLSRYIDTESSARNTTQVASDEQSVQEDAFETDPHLEELARVNWNFFTGTWMVYEGEIVTVAKLMPPTNWTKAARVFTGPDGHQYVWKMGSTNCLLYRRNGPGKKDTKVVNIIDTYSTRRKRALFEVDDSLVPFLDLVLLTWIFIEQRRKGE